MRFLLRKLAAVLCIFTLAACGESSAPANGGAPAEPGSVTLGSAQNLPDWLLVARQRDCRSEDPRTDQEQCIGTVHFNQRTITRSADGTADIWIQVRHGQPQLYQSETETTETTLRFQLERLRYRFRCADGQFVVVERQIMGANDTVIAREEPMQIYRAPARGSVTGIIQPIACRGG